MLQMVTLDEQNYPRGGNMGETSDVQAEVSRFVALSNIARFTALLEQEADRKERALLLSMLAEERERLRQSSG
jgi:hypothetical protein